jgi:ABC-2 type transport system ATP-binding protein
MNGPPIVRAENASKRYGEVLGLNGFTASFGPGITGLVGPNGAGKSTLFRVLTGQLRLDAGTITLLGKETWNTPEKNRALGFCPDHAGLYDWMNPREFVSSLLLLNGVGPSEAAQRTQAALETVEMWEFRDRKIRTFSKGMIQRVKVAQAIAHQPTVLLLDEPLNGMDPMGRASLLALFQKLAEEGRHLIVSSHVLHEVERLTSQIVMISNGRALAEGDLHRIRDLLDQHPHTIQIETTTPRLLAQILSDHPDVTGLTFAAPGILMVQTAQPDAFFQSLPEVALKEGVNLTGVRSLDDNLEAVFRLLSR